MLFFLALLLSRQVIVRNRLSLSMGSQGAGIWINDLPITSRPALPTELQPPIIIIIIIIVVVVAFSYLEHFVHFGCI